MLLSSYFVGTPDLENKVKVPPQIRIPPNSFYI